MIRLAIRTLRFRKGTFVAAFLAMFFGAAIVMACGGLMETGIRTAVPPQQLTDADIVVTGDQRYEAPEFDDEQAFLPERVRVDDGLVETIAALPGVEDATGHVFDGEPPAGTIDAIGVVAEPAADTGQLRELIDAELGDARGVTRAVTLVGDERGLAELPQAADTTADLIALAGVFGGWAIMVSVFGVASMLALSVLQRQREMALLRAVGTTPRQLRRLVLGETLMLSVFATALAYFPGQYLGTLAFERMTEAGVVSPGVAFHQGWIPTVVAIGASVLAAVGGALVAGRRAGRTRPTQALAEASLPDRLMGGWRVFFAVFFLSGGVALGTVTITVMSGPIAASTAGPAVILWAIGLALLTPALTKALTAVLHWPLRAVSGLSGQLAMLNIHARTARTAAVVAPIVMLTGIATGTLYLQTTEQDASRQEFADGLVADVVVTSPDRLDPELVAQIAAMPGVAGASEYTRSIGFVERPRDAGQDEEGLTLQGVTAEGAAETTPVSVTDGALTDLRGESVAIEADHATTLGVGTGDTITLRMGDNSTLDVEVVALFTAAERYNTVLLPADVLASHTTEGYAREILVKADEGTSEAQLVAGLDELIAEYDGLSVADREDLFAGYAEQQQTMAFANYTIVIMIVAYAAISVINALASSTNARRREFGLQRLTGSTRGQVLRMVGMEGVLVAAIGVVLGTISSIATLVPFSLARTDSPLPAGSPLIYVVIVGTALALTLGATVVPGWRAMRVRAAEAAVAPE